MADTVVLITGSTGSTGGIGTATTMGLAALGTRVATAAPWTLYP
jgi:NAD(P)-dependent dehydrogenase (short-subunit alcohol dehydrogenase family)